MSQEKLTTLPKIIDYDIHRIIGIRLINPTANDAARVAYQLGQRRTTLSREPDIIINFREKLSTPGLKYLGVNSAGFTDEGFYILTSGWAKTKVRIPFEKIGSQCEILCESGLNWFPLLNLIVTLTLIKKGYVPFHASAFVYNGTGIVVMGWKTAGKTVALLSFANHGAHYVGDEWVVLSSDGKQMFGIPGPICIKDWQLKYISNVLPKLNLEKRILFKSVHILDAIQRTFGQGRLKKIFLIKFISQALPALKRQLKIWVSPLKFFKHRFWEKPAVPDRLFLIMMHDKPGITVEPCDPMEIAKRMISSHKYEMIPLLEYYQAFKFAFPDLKNEFLENLDELQTSLISQALYGKKAYKVLRPYPHVSFNELFEEMQPFCEKTTREPVQKVLV